MKNAQMDIVSFRELLGSLDPEEREKLARQEREQSYGRLSLKSAYEWEVTQLVEAAMWCERPQVVMRPFYKVGRQNIAEFWVNDLVKPHADTINFHGQNTSQWVYAGCILVEEGHVSCHH